MKSVPVGNSAIRISRVGLGGVLFGREINESASRELLDYGLEQGVTLIDTAEAYGGGNARQYRRTACKVDDVREVSGEMNSSEKIIGRWLHDRRCRERVVICTKFNSGGTAARVKRCLSDSLERLQTDYVDIYMPHCPFPDVPIQETLEALTEEQRAGRIRTIGCSNFSAELLRDAIDAADRHGLARMESIQPAFSLAAPDAAGPLFRLCAEKRVTTMTYSPLAAGFLTGKYSASGAIPKGTRFDIIPAHADIYFNERNFRIVENLRALANETGKSMSALAMTWVFQHPGVGSVLVGARNRAQLDNALDVERAAADPALQARMDGWLA